MVFSLNRRVNDKLSLNCMGTKMGGGGGGGGGGGQAKRGQGSAEREGVFMMDRRTGECGKFQS